MTVQDLARTEVMTAHPDQSAANLATVMREEGVGSVIIVEEERPVGIVTDRDLVVHVLEPRANSTEMTASEIMPDDLVTISGDVGLLEATEIMASESVRRLPVIDHDERLSGIVTLDDLVDLLTNELSNLTAVIEAESPPY